jgi:hypothetical protein
MLMLSMRKNVRNSTIREKIYKHIADINTILTDYDDWVVGKSLKKQISKLNNTLEIIKNHPQYVQSHLNS